jgi:LysR family transcriptional regulator, glycine cleavage system transcriptional activator
VALREPETKRRLLSALNALRAFESVARLGSFTHAAEELGVTQSAVSRQVKGLEAPLGLALFRRTTRLVELTDQGKLYIELIRGALGRIETATRELLISRQDKGILSISTPSAFAIRWLMPRLPDFQDRHPDIVVQLASGDGPVDFAQRTDMAVTFGEGTWPDATAERLIGDELVLVCAPKLLAGRHPPTSLQAIRHHRLLQMSVQPQIWTRWLSSVGMVAEDLQWGVTTDSFLLSIRAATVGLGLALAPRLLAESELTSGTLVTPLRDVGTSSDAHYVVTPRAKADLPRVQAFRQWLLEEAATRRGQ